MVINSIQEARKIYGQRLIRRDLFEEGKTELQSCLCSLKKRHENVVKARAVVQEVAKETQQKIEYDISNLVTMALAYVFPEPWEFKLRFVERRNVTEADFIFSKGENEVDDILESGGGGVADIANLAIMVSLYALKKTRPVFINDEPDKFLHNPAYQERASELIKMLCKEFNVQFIIVSDQQNIIAAADKVIRVAIKNGESYIEESK